MDIILIYAANVITTIIRRKIYIYLSIKNVTLTLSYDDTKNNDKD